MSTNEENISDPNIAKPPTQKKPSGYQYELMRRERAERQKEAARLRAPYLAERAARPPAVPVRPERAHLFMLGELVQQACDIANDPGLTEEDRWDRRNATAHAMAKISANAECEREAAEQAARELGWRMTVVPATGVQEGIDAVRRVHVRRMNAQRLADSGLASKLWLLYRLGCGCACGAFHRYRI